MLNRLDFAERLEKFLETPAALESPYTNLDNPQATRESFCQPNSEAELVAQGTLRGSRFSSPPSAQHNKPLKIENVVFEDLYLSSHYRGWEPLLRLLTEDLLEVRTVD